MTRYDALAVVQAAENLAAIFHPKSKTEQQEISHLIRDIRRKGRRSADLIEHMNREFAAYKHLIPKLDREKERLDREVGKLRLKLFSLRGMMVKMEI